MNTFNTEIQGWAEQYGIELNEEYEAHAGYYEHDVLESIYRCLVNPESNEDDPMPGVMASKNAIEWELGESPENYYPFCINDVLTLINENSDQKWTLDKLDTTDDWMTADVSLLEQESGEVFQLKIRHVDQSGTVSGNFPIVMEAFSKEYTPLTLICFPLDYLYRMFVFTHESAAELMQLVRENCEPYPGSEDDYDDDEDDIWDDEE